jgi:flagellar biosynthesis protein FlhF
MKIKKFEGATMRDAIAKVKAELGEHAVIVATREVRKGLLGSGVEISAAIDEDERIGPTMGGPVAPRAHEPEVEKLIEPLRSELRSLRAMVRASNPSNDLRNELVALRRLVEDLRGTPAEPRTPAAATTALTLRSTARAVMLVGPTGAGKTTTIAKLAARAALIENRRVRLVTLDSYRVGGVEQIRMFAELIGVPLEVLQHPGDLRDVLASDHETVFVDTAGRSPRDQDAIGELAAHTSGLGLEVHLAVPAATSPAHVDQLAQRYRALAPTRLLYTKLDEVDSAPDLAQAPARLRLPVTWVTTGQAVPEDLEQPTSARLVELATSGLQLEAA